MRAISMKTVAKIFNNKILFRNKRPIDLQNEMSDRNFLRESDIWLLFVAVSTIVSAACRTRDSSNCCGNNPMKIAMINRTGLMIDHPNHHPNEIPCKAKDRT